ncbi:DUF1641 domain-containing protein [Halorarum halobium]|uniref:DUF1641 domain-containing protein n=1 Tax=Halorarum halobium TaxID=3075121 RepID=UPI0028AE13C7|nr:DUF1641 domain-containing protein [Halobaculum sp. XH14]
MAEPRDTYPESATNRGETGSVDGAGDGSEAGDGEAAVREAIAEHGDRLAAAIDASDELSDLLATAILVVASADEDELDRLTDSTANLVAAADGLSTEEAAALAEEVGANGAELVEALDVVLTLQRDGSLEELVALAGTLSALDLDAEAVEGLNDLLGAVGEAGEAAEPVGPLGALAGLRDRDARAGLGYLLALLRALGHRLGSR